MGIVESMLPIFDATPETFDRLALEPRNELVVVDFWGPGCPNCDVFAEAAPSLLQELGDAPVRIVKVNAYEHESLARRFALFGIPTFLLFRDGKLLGRMSQYYGREYWLGVIRERLPDAAMA
jgi:thiol-disulfide isomerase/thioredoxin